MKKETKDAPYCPPDGHSEREANFSIELDRLADDGDKKQFRCWVYGGKGKKVDKMFPIWISPVKATASEAMRITTRIMGEMSLEFCVAAETGIKVVPPEKYEHILRY